MSDPSDHEYQFNPRVAVGDVEPYTQRATEASATARQRLTAEYDVSYGDSPLMTCDIFPASSDDAPVHVFVHGGYWRGRDKADYSFLAGTLVPEGITTVVINYDLCPSVTVDVIVEEIGICFDWVRSRMGQSAKRLVASGHSAGAHLLAMADIRSQRGKANALGIDHAVLISGLYDLRPVLEVSVNETIGLTREFACQLSPSLYPLRPSMPVDIVVGGAESSSWVGQSRDYASHISARGGCRILEGHDHYSIMEEFMVPTSELSRLLIERSHG
ncbi:arylformamidase [Natronocella acetinitrilica]|uniref:Arylformamidase n=1 Tax=Natronocella acetinitrilica TaxID=414046 RepID=A0AAE3KHJ2_9GAMM|nr:alpha/beta hydrolase [Natronocella acetinitrilica]MCP1676402.1 arylformamidase [Natronocella acetinitrilica]